MKYHLIVSSEVKNRISQITDYVFMNWGLIVYQNLLDELEHCFHIIELNPHTFPLSLQNTNIRECVVTPLNKIFYTIQGSDIIILSIEDVRMDPRKMLF